MEERQGSGLTVGEQVMLYDRNGSASIVLSNQAPLSIAFALGSDNSFYTLVYDAYNTSAVPLLRGKTSSNATDYEWIAALDDIFVNLAVPFNAHLWHLPASDVLFLVAGTAVANVYVGVRASTGDVLWITSNFVFQLIDETSTLWALSTQEHNIYAAQVTSFGTHTDDSLAMLLLCKLLTSLYRH